MYCRNPVCRQGRVLSQASFPSVGLTTLPDPVESIKLYISGTFDSRRFSWSFGFWVRTDRGSVLFGGVLGIYLAIIW